MIYTDRLVTNLKFILSRMIQNRPAVTAGDEELNAFVRMHCPKEVLNSRKDEDYIKSVIRL